MIRQPSEGIQPNSELKVLRAMLRFTQGWTSGSSYERWCGAAELEIDPQDLKHFYPLATSGIVKPSEFALHQGIGASAVSKIIARFTAVGYVTRRANPEDARSNYIVLTQKGMDAAQRLFDVVEEELKLTLETWSQRDISAIGALVTRLADDSGY